MADNHEELSDDELDVDDDNVVYEEEIDHSGEMDPDEDGDILEGIDRGILHTHYEMLIF